MMNKITVAYLRDLEKQVSLGEISYSRMVELLNEKVGGESSPVSQQLTREKVVEIIKESIMLNPVEGIREEGDEIIFKTDLNSSCDKAAEAICQLSVSPAQKEIETLKSEIKQLKKDSTHQSYDIAKKSFLKDIIAKDKEIEELKAEMSVLREMNNGYAKELTSKESDVNRAVSVLESMEKLRDNAKSTEDLLPILRIISNEVPALLVDLKGNK